IETVYQDLALVDTMSAVQNIFLGREELSGRRALRAFNLVGDRSMRKQARQVLTELGVKVPSVNVSVKGMSGGQRQCLAIAGAVPPDEVAGPHGSSPEPGGPADQR